MYVKIGSFAPVFEVKIQHQGETLRGLFRDYEADHFPFIILVFRPYFQGGGQGVDPLDSQIVSSLSRDFGSIVPKLDSHDGFFIPSFMNKSPLITG